MEINDICFCTQPIVGSDYGKNSFGYEILARFGREKRESIERILKQADYDEKEKIDLFILECILERIEQFSKIDNKININVHINTLFNDSYIKLLIILKKKGFNISLELLESSYLDFENENIYFGSLNRRINTLQEQGIKIGIDDYPVGISGKLLENIKKLDFIKIDKKILLNEEGDFISVINQYIVSIRKYHKTALIIIEGVEKGRYIDSLLELGVDAFQGYYFGRPQLI